MQPTYVEHRERLLALFDHLERHPQHRATTDGHRGEGHQAQLASSVARLGDKGGGFIFQPGALPGALEPAQEDEVGAHHMLTPVSGPREGARVHRDDDRHTLCDESGPRANVHRMQPQLATQIGQAYGSPKTRTEERRHHRLEALLAERHDRLRLEEPRVSGRVARRDDTWLHAEVDHGHGAYLGAEQPDARSREGADEQVDGLRARLQPLQLVHEDWHRVEESPLGSTVDKCLYILHLTLHHLSHEPQVCHCVRIPTAWQEADGTRTQLGDFGQHELAPIELRADRDEPAMRVGQALGECDKWLHVAPRATRHDEQMPRERARGEWLRYHVPVPLQRCGGGSHGHLAWHHWRAHERRVAQSVLDEKVVRRLCEQIAKGEQRRPKGEPHERSFGDDAHDKARLLGWKACDRKGQRGPGALAGVVA